MHSQRASLASRSRVWNLAGVAGHVSLCMPPMIVFGAGRVLAAAVALTHLFERPTSHDRIVADGAPDAIPPPPTAPIIIVPHPDIRAPPPAPRRRGAPSGGPPPRKHGSGGHRPDRPARTHDLSPAPGFGLRPTPPGDETGGAP